MTRRTPDRLTGNPCSRCFIRRNNVPLTVHIRSVTQGTNNSEAVGKRPLCIKLWNHDRLAISVYVRRVLFINRPH